MKTFKFFTGLTFVMVCFNAFPQRPYLKLKYGSSTWHVKEYSLAESTRTTYSSDDLCAGVSFFYNRRKVDVMGGATADFFITRGRFKAVFLSGKLLGGYHFSNKISVPVGLVFRLPVDKTFAPPITSGYMWGLSAEGICWIRKRYGLSIAIAYFPEHCISSSCGAESGIKSEARQVSLSGYIRLF